MTSVPGTDLEVLPSQEESQQRFAQIGARIRDSLTDDSLCEWWARRVDVSPDSPLLETDAASLSYAEVDAIANRVARVAARNGVRNGDVVAVQLPACGAYLALVLGLAKLGARLSLLSPALRGRSLRHALDEVPARIVFTTRDGERAIAALDPFDAPRLFVLDLDEATLAAPSDSGLAALERCLSHEEPGSESEEHAPAPADVDPDATLFYIFTSGTTGLPKATQCSHRRYIAGASSESILLDLDAADCMYAVLPMFHIAALSAIGAAIASGASVVIRPRFSASRFWEDVRRFSVTGFQYLGEIVRYLLAQPERDGDRPNSLRTMIGAGLTTRTWRAFELRFGPVRIVESYGSSEGVIGIFNLDGVAGSVGRAPAPLEERLRIVRYDVARDDLERDSDGRLLLCEEGMPGELIARLESRKDFEGYSSAEATRSKLIEGAFEEGDLWYRSGDLFRQLDGYYFFAGRLGDTYRWKGENVSTQQVAEVLVAGESVEHALVYGVEVPGNEGSAGMALVSLRSGAVFDGAKLYAQLAAELPPHAIPLFVRLGSGESVLTDTYKLGTAKLKQQGYDPGSMQDPLYLLDVPSQNYIALDDAALRDARLPAFRVDG